MLLVKKVSDTYIWFFLFLVQIILIIQVFSEDWVFVEVGGWRWTNPFIELLVAAKNVNVAIIWLYDVHPVIN